MKIFSMRAFSLLLVLGLFSQVIGSTNSGVSTVSASANDFVIRYCIHDNYSGAAPYSDDQYLSVYSNQTATYELIQDRWGTPSTNWTGKLSSALVSKLHETLISEGFMSLNDSYNDSGWSSTVANHLERACIEVSGELKTVTFNGNSMMGRIPASFALLNNIIDLVVGGLADLPDATLDIVVTEPSDHGPTAKITANFANNGDTTLRDSGLCNTSWPAFIVSANGSTLGDMQAKMAPYCLMEFAPRTTTPFGPWEWNRTGLSPGNYVIMSRVVIWDFEIGNIDSNSTWTSVEKHAEPIDHFNVSILVLAGLGIAVAVGVATFYIARIRQNERQGSK